LLRSSVLGLASSIQVGGSSVGVAVWGDSSVRLGATRFQVFALAPARELDRAPAPAPAPAPAELLLVAAIFYLGLALTGITCLLELFLPPARVLLVAATFCWESAPRGMTRPLERPLAGVWVRWVCLLVRFEWVKVFLARPEPKAQLD
jgi:hypothetical protein